MIGIGNALLAASEFPFHIGPGRRWMKSLGIKRCMVAVMLVGAFRWLLAYKVREEGRILSRAAYIITSGRTDKLKCY